MSIYTRIKNLCESKEISFYKLEKECDLSRQSIEKWKDDKIKPSANAITKIADYFDVTTDYILGRELPKGAIPVSEHQYKLPILGNVRAGRGGCLETEVMGYRYIEAEKLKGNTPDDFFFLHVKGDSMSPKIDDGDYVLIKKQTSVDSGTLAVVSIDNDEAVVKKVVYGKTWIELHSFNPYYPVRRFDGADVERIFVIGKLKQRITDF